MSDSLAYNRRQLLLNLKDSANKLMPYVHNSNSQPLNENNPLANILCDNIEMCLLYGIRITDFYGVIPLWGLLGRLEISSTTPLLFRQSITALSGECHSSLRTPLARARGWIRFALNQKVLDRLLEFIMSSSISQTSTTSSISNTTNANTNATLSPTTSTNVNTATANHLPLLNRYYHAYSIILTPADVNIFIAVIRSLKIFSFAFDLNSSELSLVPLWISHFLQPEKIISTTLAADSRKFLVSNLIETATGNSATDAASPTHRNNNKNGSNSNINNVSNTVISGDRPNTTSTNNYANNSNSNISSSSTASAAAGIGGGTDKSTFFSLLQKDIYDVFQIASAALVPPSEDDNDGNTSSSATTWHNTSGDTNYNTNNNNNKRGSNIDNTASSSNVVNSSYSDQYPKSTGVPTQLNNKLTSNSAYSHSSLGTKNNGSNAIYSSSSHSRIKPRLSMYGTSLRDLVLDDTRCPHAFMEPRLGMPKQIFTLIHYINKHIDTPGLFRKKGPSEQIKRLRMSLEAEAGIPSVVTSGTSASSNEMSVHTVTYVLLEWLNQLPEPLLGYQHYDAIQACFVTLSDNDESNNEKSTGNNTDGGYGNRIESTNSLSSGINSSSIHSKSSNQSATTLEAENAESGVVVTHHHNTHHHRIRNISLLVNESPWYNQPLLCRLLALLSNCLHPTHIFNNELTLNTLAVLLTPSLFRNKSHNHAVSPYRFNSSGGGGGVIMQSSYEYDNSQAMVPPHIRSTSSANIGASSPSSSSSSSSSGGMNHRSSSSSYRDLNELNRCLLTSTASGSAVTEFFLLHEAAVLQHVRDHLSEVHNALQTKCVRLRRIQESINTGVNVILIYKCVTALLNSSSDCNSFNNNDKETSSSSNNSGNSNSSFVNNMNNNDTAPSISRRTQHRQRTLLLITTLSLIQRLWHLLEGVECRRKSIDIPDHNSSGSSSGGAGGDAGNDIHATINHGNSAIISNNTMITSFYQHKKKSHHHHHHHTTTTTDSATGDENTDDSAIVSLPVLQELESLWQGSLESLLSSSRWEIAGFTNTTVVINTTNTNTSITTTDTAAINTTIISPPQPLIQLHNPFQDFTLCAVTAVDCLAYALTHYEGRVAMIIIEFAQSRKRYCTLGQVAGSICSNIAQVLGLMTISTNMQSEYPPIQYLARQAHWQLLSDENVFYELFVMLLLSYDDYWKRLTNKAHQLPHSDTHTFCLEYVLTILYSLLSPQNSHISSISSSSGNNSTTTPVVIRSVEKLWEVWTLQRVSQQVEEEESKDLKNTAASVANSSSSGSGGDALNNNRGGAYNDNTSASINNSIGHNSATVKSRSNSTTSSAGYSNTNDDNSSSHNDYTSSKNATKNLNYDDGESNSGGVVVMGGEEDEYIQNVNDADNVTLYRDHTHRTVTASGSSGYSGSIPVPLLRQSSVLKYEPQSDHSHEADILPVSHHSAHSSPLPSSSSSLRQSPKSFITSDIVNSTGGNMIPENITATNSSEFNNNNNSSNNNNVIVVPRMNSMSKTSVTMMTDTKNSNNSNVMYKSISGIETKVTGRSLILTQNQIQQIEAGLSRSYQCLDWSLVYRLTRDGASVDTLIRRAAAAKTEASLLVIQDSNKVIFGALITEKIKLENTDKYYGSGTICVWSFVSGVFALYPSTNRNNYFLISADPFGLALGGGGNFALYLDGDLNKGSSGHCDTFNSPCLSSSSPFTCVDCELYKLSSPFA